LTDEVRQEVADAIKQEESLTKRQRFVLATVATLDPLDELAEKINRAAIKRLQKDGVTSYYEARTIREGGEE
jgi:hypothetical protein